MAFLHGGLPACKKKKKVYVYLPLILLLLLFLLLLLPPPPPSSSSSSSFSTIFLHPQTEGAKKHAGLEKGREITRGMKFSVKGGNSPIRYWIRY